MKFRLIFISPIVILALMLIGCGNKTESTESAQKAAKQATEGEKDVNVITVRAELANRIKIGQPSMIDLADKIQVPSRVEVDEERLVHIGSYVTGRIVDMFVILGDYVKVGDRLARITSPELTQAQLAFLRASSRVVVTQKAADRARHLLAADVIPLAEVERRISELEIAQAELGAAKDQLSLLGVDDSILKQLASKGQILPYIDIKSTHNGYIINRNVIVGQVVQPADPLFQVADLSSVWVVGDIPEQIARDVQAGQHVEIHIPAMGDTHFDGVIIFVADIVNPLTRTVMVRTMVKNPHRKLKPDMLANMHITDNQHKSLVVPETAVVRESNLDYVFIAKGNNKFRRTPVELGSEVAGYRPVVSGITIDQKIVMDGAFHLDSERKLAELE
ncbi:MAG: efflux RND transporter periplasmic adaptor subunit [Nitrosomonas sp.]|jgi:cobalt-zinc-cadmium efflux system membrane fusion protein|nr:efflux RND transporter periplasmic adaptor subunit [Nitrosomonas sp.]MBP7111503.1 efflux RND transporter periplasmic adaptor subunit [Nitrosomonas sp.]